MAYGYIGAEPTNDKSSNNGVFDITELNKLRTNEKFIFRKVSMLII